MASIVQKLETKGVIMTLLSLVLISTGCEDKIDSPAVNPSEGKTVEVSLNLGIADEADGAGMNISPKSKSANPAAFDVQLLPDIRTKATDIPTQIYNLEIMQYDASGNKIGSATPGNIVTGTSLSVNLTAATNCQLLLVARGNQTDFAVHTSISTLDGVRNDKVKAEGSKINAIATDATGSGLANMPYYLYLEKVNIVNVGGEYKIQSPEGSDVRLLLKRLATRLTLNWSISQSMKTASYILKEVRLCQVPAHYRLQPKTEPTDRWGNVYPSSISEFVDVYRLKGTEIENGTTTAKTVWIPANARGISAYATSPIYRNKENANPAATYAEFVVDNKEKKERLYYRAYLGGNETNDFNLFENTNYRWTVNINQANYTRDPRIRLLDQTAVISANLQPTANCFMMVPGTNICFNPYKHTSGTDGWNDYLTDGTTLANDKIITNVKLIWQTKDAGTSGDLVVGYVIDDNQHENLVNLTNGNDKEKALIHVKVPVTDGGNALIAACHTEGGKETIVWSWHLWITDYVPQSITSSISYQKAQELTRGGSVHQYATTIFTTGNYKNKVMMDRNLCAVSGGFPEKDASDLEYGKRTGYQYQWGRKDPFFGSVDGTTNEINVIYDGDGKAIGIDLTAYSEITKTDGNTLEWSIQHPASFIKGNHSWYNGDITSTAPLKLYDNEGKKTLYDPCPNGWTLVDKSAVDGITINSAYWFDSDGTFKQKGNSHLHGGRLYNLSGNTGVPTPITIHNTAWYPITAYRSAGTGMLGIGEAGYLGFRNIGLSSGSYAKSYFYYYTRVDKNLWYLGNGMGPIAETAPYRCIQE